MNWIVLRRHLVRVVLPFKHSEAISGWMSLIPYGGAIVSVVIGFVLGSPVAMVAFPLLFFLGLSVFAGYNAEAELFATKERRFPKNRDAVIRSARDVELKAMVLITSFEQSLLPPEERQAGYELESCQTSFYLAHEEYWTEWLIAGEEFRAIIWYMQKIDSLVRTAEGASDRGDANQDTYQWLRERCIDSSYRLVRSIDNGTSTEPWGEEPEPIQPLEF